MSEGDRAPPPGTDSVSLDEARRSEPKVVEPDARAAKEAAEYAHKENTQKMDLGWVGLCLGARSEKPGNVAFIVIILCFIVIAWACATKALGAGDDNFFKLLTTMLGPVGLALGYLFGSGSRRD